MSENQVQVSNLTRSCNEALLLAILSEGALHGYQIALRTSEVSGGSFSFKHGTLYPILHSLEKKGFIEGVWQGKKKAYTLTESGQEYRNRLFNSWRRFTDTFMGVIREVCDE